jgi:type II secretory pathway component PulJ
MIPVAKHHRRGAFTLVEILVSSVILLILLGLLLGMGERISGFWHASEGKRRIQRELLAAIRTMEADLRHAAVTSDASTLMIRSTPSAPGLKENHALFFLASGEEADAKTGSDLSAVGYFVAQSPEKKGQWNLYRFHASEKETRAAILSGGLSSLYAKASAADTTTSELLSENISGLSIAADREQGLPGLLTITMTGMTGPFPTAATPSENAARVTREGRQMVSLVRLPPVVQESTP